MKLIYSVLEVLVIDESYSIAHFNNHIFECLDVALKKMQITQLRNFVTLMIVLLFYI